MEFGREATFPGTAGLNMPGFSADNCMPGYSDQAIWATEDDYGAWNGDASADSLSDSNYDGGRSHAQSGREPLNKKSRNCQGDSQGNSYDRDRDLLSGNRSKTIGRMFFKTKLCCKFRAGTCPYITNCNFAHGNEELRKPPPNWQEIVAAKDGDPVLLEPREQHQIPSLSSSGMDGEIQRSYKGRHCKKFYTEDGCPYGDACTFLHDKQSKARESVAISLGPTAGTGYGGNNSNLKPLNWKTRTCNKWETTGHCPFGIRCHFAHGSQELNKNQGGFVEMGGRDSSSAPPGVKQVVALSRTPTNTVTLSSTPVPHSDVYHMGANSQRSTGVTRRRGQSPHQKWKGPNKISRVYGDWIDDIE